MPKLIIKESLVERKFSHTLLVPKDAKLLSIVKQKEVAVAYFEVDESNMSSKLVPFVIKEKGTGPWHKWEDSPKLEYVSTIMWFEDSLVYHFYKES